MIETSPMLTGKSMHGLWRSTNLVQAPSLSGREHTSYLPWNDALAGRVHGFKRSLGKRKLVNNNLSVLLYHNRRKMELGSPWLVVLNGSICRISADRITSSPCLRAVFPENSQLPLPLFYTNNLPSDLQSGFLSRLALEHPVYITGPSVQSLSPIALFFILESLIKFSEVHEFLRKIFKCCVFIWKIHKTLTQASPGSPPFYRVKPGNINAQTGFTFMTVAVRRSSVAVRRSSYNVSMKAIFPKQGYRQGSTSSSVRNISHYK